MNLIRFSTVACILIILTQIAIVSCFAQELNFKETKLNITSETNDNYDYAVDLDMYFTPENQLSEEELKRILKVAQSKFDKCKIRLDLKSSYIVQSSSDWISEWETLEFEDGNITDWESAFFEFVLPYSAGLFFVNSLDWTIGDDGVTAAAYPLFYLQSGQVSGGHEAQKFYEEKMVGYSIIGQAVSEWTITHELGHSILNLQHNDNPENLMFAMGKKGQNPQFTSTQCERGKLNNPRIRAI